MVKSFGFIQNPDELCVCKKCEGKVVSILVLYVDDILLIGNDVAALSTIKVRLANTFDMKDLRKASYFLVIKLIRDRKRKIMGLSQASYIDKVLTRFSMDNSKKGLLPFRHGLVFSKE